LSELKSRLSREHSTNVHRVDGKFYAELVLAPADSIAESCRLGHNGVAVIIEPIYQWPARVEKLSALLWMRLHSEMIQCCLPQVIGISFSVGGSVENFLRDFFHFGVFDRQGEARYRLVQRFSHNGNRFFPK
jgi:hypothetical protein